jgi:hypothetical protein
MVSSFPSTQPRSEAEQIVLLTKELEWSRLKIQALEERLRLELIHKYGPKSEKLSDHQLQLLDLEPGVSAAEVEAESRREPLPAASPAAKAKSKDKKHPGRQELPAHLPRVERIVPCADHRRRSMPTLSRISRPVRLRQWSTVCLQKLRQRQSGNRLRTERTAGCGARPLLRCRDPSREASLPGLCRRSQRGAAAGADYR